MIQVTPVGIKGYTSANLAPKLNISPTGVMTSRIGGLTISPHGAYLPGPPKAKPNPTPIQNPETKWTTQPIPSVPAHITEGIVKSAIKPVAPKPISVTKPTVPAWETNPDYQGQMAAIERALNQYKANMGVETSRAGTQFANSDRDMVQSKDRDLKNMMEDYASRGTVTSGVYGQSVGDYTQLWNQQHDDLSNQYKMALEDINRGYNDYLIEVQAQKEQARLDSIKRLAQELELNPPKANSNSNSSKSGTTTYGKVKLKDGSVETIQPTKDKKIVDPPWVKKKPKPKKKKKSDGIKD